MVILTRHTMRTYFPVLFILRGFSFPRGLEPTGIVPTNLFHLDLTPNGRTLLRFSSFLERHILEVFSFIKYLHCLYLVFLLGIDCDI